MRPVPAASVPAPTGVFEDERIVARLDIPAAQTAVDADSAARRAMTRSLSST
jgi:hypothetical protein